VLNGTGNAATFTGSFNEAGTYTARTIADELYCATAMSRSHVIVKNPLPANPDVNNGSRNCPGTVTLSAFSPGAVIDWYADASTTTKLKTAASYTTPEIATSTTYYVQARVESTGCVSARVPVSATVNMEGCCTAPGATVDFTAFVPCPNAGAGSTWTLRDTRAGGNNNAYIVKMMADGHIWMVQDLKFGSCGAASITYYSDDSNTATTHKPTVFSNATITYVGHCTSEAVTNTPANRGYLYTWAGAMNNTNAWHGNSDASFECRGTTKGSTAGSKAPALCRGICPEGWHIPTGNTDGEWYTLYNAGLGDVYANWGAGGYTEIDGNDKHLHLVLGGFYQPGYTMPTNEMRYATSTLADSRWEYSHRIILNTSIQPGTSKDWQTVALMLRCVYNY
jgi:uncharacterized protein (TIGR02145 family)